VAERLPLSALLSQTLVAFTIELDNEWERQVPHQTTSFGGERGAPWAVSLALWSNFMRVLDEDGVTVAELERRARAVPHLSGMQRWGYVVVEPDPDDDRPRPPRRDWVVRPTAAGRRAQAAWRPLPAAIEDRWRARFGEDRVAGLRADLEDLVSQLALALPEFLTCSYAGFAREPVQVGEALPRRLPLSALLSQPLHALALEFERGSQVSLQYCANVIRVLDEGGVPPRELPRRTGVAIEPLRTALGILAKRGYLSMEPDPAGRRGKVVRLTGAGLRAKETYGRLPGEIEERWRARFGAREIDELRRSLEALAQAPDGERAPLWLGLEPPPGTWRAQIPSHEILPHYPHPRQGGHPDGA
jgi:DNA-binding MarR family transcriptional regulator